MRTREAGVDAMRVVLCLAVAVLHSVPRTDAGTPPVWAVLLASPCRGAVPFFFVASGVFARVPDRLSPGLVGRPLARLLPVYLAWLLIYALVGWLAWDEPFQLSLKTLATGGSAFHLWFLPVLGLSLLLVPAGLFLVGPVPTGLACLALAAANVAFVGWREVLHLPEIAGTRMMIGPPLLFCGMMLARARRPGPRLPAVALLCAVAWIATLAEEAAIARLAHASLLGHNDVATTFALGIALFLFARALPPSRVIAALARLGPISLGIYAAHLLFVRALLPVIGQDTAARALLLAFAAFACATVLSAGLARVPLLRRLVQ